MSTPARGGTEGAELLILGQLEPELVERLSARYRTRTVESPGASGAEGAPEVRGIVVRSPFRVTAATIHGSPRLRGIVRAGSGTDNIDLEAAAARGIRVATTPLAGPSVAELAFALLLAVARQIPAMHGSVAAGEWRKWEGMGTELRGKTLLVVGFGRIGRAVAGIARGFGMEVVVSDPTPERAEKAAALRETGAAILPLDAALSAADVVVLCCPLLAHTRGMVGGAELARLRGGAILVNVGRDELVDGPALLAALRSGRLGGAAIDAFSSRGAVDPELVRHPRVVATPHIGAQTREAHGRIGREVERLVDELLTPEHL